MRVTFHAVDVLPRGTAAGLLEGEGEVCIYLDAGATAAQIAQALTELIDPWAQQSWIYTGDVASPHLRALP